MLSIHLLRLSQATIFPSDEEDLWLAPEVEDAELLKDCLRPFPSEEMVLTRVSDRVNSPTYDSPENIKPSQD
jgi:putative SOS response-associated peptidase YedK